MKLWTLATFCTVSLLILNGCSNKPRPSDKAQLDGTLPVVTLTQNGVFVDTSSIAFEWQSINDPRVKGVYVYRQIMRKGEPQQEYYDTIESRFATHYVDTKIEPDTKYSYSFKTFSDTTESQKSRPTVVSSLAPIKSVPWVHTAQSMPRSAKIIWKPHESKLIKAYIIERSTLEDTDWEKIATVEGRTNIEYIDTKLEDGHVYKYRIRVLTYEGVTSAPSMEVTTTTKVLPIGVTEITATRDLPKRIKVTWTPTDAEDFSGYSVYKSDKLDGSYKLLKRTKETSLIESINEDGKNYFYRVSVVDRDGLESDNTKQSVQGQTLGKMGALSITEARLEDNKIILSWMGGDANIVNFTVTKKSRKGLFSSNSEEFTGISGHTFVDSAIEPETTYTYQVYGVDQNSIKSDPSIEAKFTTTKAQGRVIPKSSSKQGATKAPSNDDQELMQNPDNSQEVVQPIQDLIEI